MVVMVVMVGFSLAPSGSPTKICIMHDGKFVNNLAVINADSNSITRTTDGSGCASFDVTGSFFGQNFGMKIDVTFTFAGTGYAFIVPVAQSTTVTI